MEKAEAYTRGGSDPRQALSVAVATLVFAAHFAHLGSQATFDIVALGGSVEAEFGNSLPRDLRRLLRSLPVVAGRPVKVYSHGRGSYNQPQQVIMLAWLLSLGFQPDLVIDLDGVNEVAAARLNVALGGTRSGPRSRSGRPWPKAA